MMITTTLSEFRKHIKHYLNKVTDSFEPLTMNTNKGKGVVVISLNEYNSLMSTHHEMSSRINESRLDSAIAKLKSGKQKPDK